MQNWPFFNHPNYPNPTSFFSGQQGQPNPFFSQSFPFQSPFNQFAKPQLPPNWFQQMPNYPNQAMPKGNMNHILGSFFNQNGQADFDKMLSTVGNMAKTYQQISPVVKQFGSFLKGFR